MNDWLKEHIQQFMQIVGINTKPNETPVEVVKEVKTGWRGEYIDTVINIKNNVLT